MIVSFAAFFGMSRITLPPKKRLLTTKPHSLHEKRPITSSVPFSSTFSRQILSLKPGGGGGVLSEKLSEGVRPASQNPYPIYDQNLRNCLPYL